MRGIRGASAALLREGSYRAFFRGLTASLIGTVPVPLLAGLVACRPGFTISTLHDYELGNPRGQFLQTLPICQVHQSEVQERCSGPCSSKTLSSLMTHRSAMFDSSLCLLACLLACSQGWDCQNQRLAQLNSEERNLAGEANLHHSMHPVTMLCCSDMTSSFQPRCCSSMRFDVRFK